MRDHRFFNGERGPTGIPVQIVHATSVVSQEKLLASVKYPCLWKRPVKQCYVAN
jgi:hypothetical protein